MGQKSSKKVYEVKNGSYTIETTKNDKITKRIIKINDSDIRFFRYRPISDYTIEAFINDDFYASKPETFNDPYDTSIYYDETRVYNELVKHHHDVDKEMVKEIYKSIFSVMSKKSSYIASLSTNNNITSMWSHYASSGKGFVLEYSYIDLYELAKEYYISNLEQALFNIGKTLEDFYNDETYTELLKSPFLFPVNYEEEGENVTNFLLNTIDKYYKTIKEKGEGEESLHEMLKQFSTLEEIRNTNNFVYAVTSQKSLSWKYENEWRVVVNTDLFTEQYRSLGTLKPKAIYLGEFMTNANKYLLTKFAHNKNIEIYQAYTESTTKTNKLAFKKLTNDEIKENLKM